MLEKFLNGNAGAVGASREVSRRGFLKLGAGLAAMGASGSALAAVCGISPRETSGPFPPRHALETIGGRPNPGALVPIADRDADLTYVSGNAAPAQGQIVLLRGVIQDQNCTPVADMEVNIWQADDHGHYNHANDPNVHSEADLDPNFQYSARVRTDSAGRFQVRTIVPKYYSIGFTQDPNTGEQVEVFRTAHIHYLFRKSGFETLVTQSYFEGDVLQDIEVIRRLNQNDILLSPNGVIRDEFRSLIVPFGAQAGSDIPVGDVIVTVQRLF